MAALALAAPAVLTTLSGARSLGRPVIGLAPWAHFSEGRADLAHAFDDAGLTNTALTATATYDVDGGQQLIPWALARARTPAFHGAGHPAAPCAR